MILFFIIFSLFGCPAAQKEKTAFQPIEPASVIKIAKPTPEIIKEYKSVVVWAGKPGMVDTGVAVKGGDSFIILAEGEINVWPARGGFIKEPYGTLLFRIGKNNIAMRYAEHELTPVASEGHLYLGYAGSDIDTYGNPIKPEYYRDDVGYFVVDIIVWKTNDPILMGKFFDEASQKEPQKAILKQIATNFEQMAAQLAKQQKEVEVAAREMETTKQPKDIPVTTGARWAAIIGISQYKDTRIPPLRYAAADAKSFYDWAISPDGGKYAPAMVELLIDTDATGVNIKNTLFNWLAQAIQEDTVTLFFAGHGSPQSPDHPENLFLLPYDTQYDNISTTGFPMWDIETALKRFIKAKKVIVITDACHAGGVGNAFDIARRDTRGLKVVPISSSLQHLSTISDGVCIISAADDNQLSQEGLQWGEGHGVFTYFLLEGLKGKADYNKDGLVTLGELIPFLSEQVRRETRNAQTPTVSGRFDPALSIGK